MKLRKITLALLSIFMFVVACGDDDEDITAFVEKDRAVVYAEDLLEIETYLQNYTYNYDDFDFSNPNSLANDTFQIVFTEISEDNNNLDADPILDRPELLSKTVTDNSIDYKLYYLNIREGLGSVVDALDAAAVSYEGTLLDGSVFDSNTIVPITFALSSDGTSSGVIVGFREVLIEFKTRDGFTENGEVRLKI